MNVYQLAVIEKQEGIRIFRQIFNSAEKCRELMRNYSGGNCAAGLKVQTYGKPFLSDFPEKYPENEQDFDFVYFIIETTVR